MKPLGAGDPAAVASYRLVGVLGVGGMGRVYLGESRMGRRVAIKVIRDDVAEDPIFRRRFAREVAAARQVSPLFTAAVVDADPEGTPPWLATLYIEGPTLSELVHAEGQLPPSVVLTLAAGLAEALVSIHRTGLVHRDLKPSNVILNDAGPHVIDFGIAFNPSTIRLTTGKVVGTPSYLAPEIIQGEPPSPAGDIFSLGATLAFAASGRHLVTDGTAYVQMMQIATGRFDLEAVPNEVRSLVVRCLSPDPHDRPTAGELTQFLAGLGVAAPVPDWYTTRGAPGTMRALTSRGSPAPAASASSGTPSGTGPAGGGGARGVGGGEEAGWRPTPGRRLLPRRRVLAVGGLLGTAVLGSGVAVVTGLADQVLGVLGVRLQATSGAVPPSTGPASHMPTSGPGSLAWQASSGSTSSSVLSTVTQPPEPRVIVDRNQRIIAARTPEVVALDLAGQPVWRWTIPTGLVNLRAWGDAVLVTDARQTWLLDAATGTESFAMTLAEDEETGFGAQSLDGLVVEIGGVTLSESRAVVGLGTAIVAIDRRGEVLWRQPRSPARDGRRPAPDVPRVANDTWLVTHSVSDGVLRASLRRADTGENQWSVEYDVGQQLPRPPAPPVRSGLALPPPGGGELDERRAVVAGFLTDSHAVLRDARVIRVLDLANGRHLWSQMSPMPVSGVGVTSDLVVIATDRITGWTIGAGAVRWQADVRGARVAMTLDEQGIVAATNQSVCVLDLSGTKLWQVPLPDAVTGAVVESLTIDEQHAYLTFRPTAADQPAPLPVDAIAVRLT